VSLLTQNKETILDAVEFIIVLEQAMEYICKWAQVKGRTSSLALEIVDVVCRLEIGDEGFGQLAQLGVEEPGVVPLGAQPVKLPIKNHDRLPLVFCHSLIQLVHCNDLCNTTQTLQRHVTAHWICSHSLLSMIIDLCMQ